MECISATQWGEAGQWEKEAQAVPCTVPHFSSFAHGRGNPWEPGELREPGGSPKLGVSRHGCSLCSQEFPR